MALTTADDVFPGFVVSADAFVELNATGVVVVVFELDDVPARNNEQIKSGLNHLLMRHVLNSILNSMVHQNEEICTHCPRPQLNHSPLPRSSSEFKSEFKQYRATPEKETALQTCTCWRCFQRSSTPCNGCYGSRCRICRCCRLR